MSTNGPTPGELGSWKEIAQYLGVTVRTAQKWGEVRGLPVYRHAGQKGRVWANAAELDRWRAGSSRRRRFWGRLSFVRWVFLAATAILLVEVGVLGGLYLQRLLNGPPARILYEQGFLVVTDERGHQLWRHYFPEGFRAGERPDVKIQSGGAWLGDLDGDGHIELLYIYNPAERERSGNYLYCFSEGGSLKWRFVPGREVQSPHGSFAPPFIAEMLAVLETHGERRVAVTSHHVAFHPNQVAVLSPGGELRSEYWHSGRLPQLASADLDGDGSPEILLAGVSTGYRSATLVVLDPDAASGSSLEPEDAEERILGFGPASERARILFPRTCANLVLDRFNEVGRLSIRGGEVRLQVWERRVPGSQRANINYTLDRNLRVTRVSPTDRFRSLHFELEASGQLNHRLSEQEIRQWQKVRVLRPWRARGQQAEATLR
jgi:hypothetical protein